MNQKMAFMNHFFELRERLIKSFLWVGFFCLLSWFFKAELMNIVSKPISPFLSLTEGKLIFTSPVEKFFSYIKLAIFFGFLFSCPFWLHQVWKFIAPGLYKEEKKFGFLFIVFGTFLFFLGTVFIYFVVYPFSFDFLLHFAGNEIPFISLNSYLNFFIQTSLAFSLIFEIPLIIFTLIKLGIVERKTLIHSRRYAIIAIATLSAFLSPPDVTSLFLLMIPLYLLYEFSLFLSKYF